MLPHLREKVRRDWRTLGFYFDLDDASKAWRIKGTREGLETWVSILREYASNASNDMESEHEHVGPYEELKLMTSRIAQIDEQGIRGPLRLFARMAEGLQTELAMGTKVISLRPFLAPDAESAEYDVLVIVAPDGFDRAGEDPALVE